MALIAFSSQGVPRGDELPFEGLLVALSTTLATLHPDEHATTLARALEQICPGLNADRSILIEFAEDGQVRGNHAGTPGASDGEVDVDVSGWTWMTKRLREGVLVAVTRLDELPPDARGEREFATRTGMSSMLAVPAIVGGRVICALVLVSAQRVRDWQAPVRDRVRLFAELFGTAVQRLRQETSLRESQAQIERLNRCLSAGSEDIRTCEDFDEIIGDSPAMRDALERLSQVAPLNCSVLLLGETGTGKELFARAVHDRSRRRSRALVRVNCAALPSSLIESELFGHEKGAFTGAVNLRQGRFELADGGTIFLDEIGDLPLEMQGKLLRVLQEGEFERVGSSRTRRVDVRIIAATHHDLEAAVAEGRFRADLYYRLSVFPIQVPPLRERRRDILSLVWFFVHKHQRDLGRRITRVPESVLAALNDHDWPGNVRELENVIERALIRSSGETLQLDSTLGDKLREKAPMPAGTLDEVQRMHIENTLRECNWRINGVGNAAERLGIHPNTLRFRMKKLGIATRQLQRT